MRVRIPSCSGAGNSLSLRTPSGSGLVNVNVFERFRSARRPDAREAPESQHLTENRAAEQLTCRTSSGRSCWSRNASGNADFLSQSGWNPSDSTSEAPTRPKLAKLTKLAKVTKLPKVRRPTTEALRRHICMWCRTRSVSRRPSGFVAPLLVGTFVLYELRAEFGILVQSSIWMLIIHLHWIPATLACHFRCMYIH